MSTETLDDTFPEVEGVRRAPWRQRLVDAETGLRIGLRADSTLYVFCFYGGITLLTAGILGLSPLAWAVLILSLGAAFSLELLYQLIKQLVPLVQPRDSRELEVVLRLGTAAVLSMHLTAAAVTILLLWQRMSGLWG